MPPLDFIFTAIPIMSLLIGFTITGVIYRTIYIRKWIKDYCEKDLHNTLPQAEGIRIDSTLVNRSLEFTWDQTIWHKGELARAAIISDAALKAFNDYQSLFLYDKTIFYVSIKAIKQMSFRRALIATCYSSPKWGAEISISYTDKVHEKEGPKKKCITMEDLWVNERPEEIGSLPIPSRHIVVCRNV